MKASTPRHSILTIPLLLLLGVFACNYPSRVITPSLPAPTRPVLPSPVILSQTLPLTPSQSPSPTLASTPSQAAITSTIEYQPVFEPAACDFAVPTCYNPDCGYLVVPESRSLPESPDIRLHVAVFHSLSANPAPDPVVHLAGGPGSSSLDDAWYLFSRGLNAFLEQRDFILFDQRGTGHSLPRLDCPEQDSLASFILNNRLSSPMSQQAILDSFRKCHQRLSDEGIDLSSYNSATSAADVNDLRLALGYEKLNLYGVSYGTRLALTIMRDYPEAVRSAVLDSTYPPQVNLYVDLARNAERAFNILFDSCASDPECSTSYPDLRQVFYDLVDQLNAAPVAVDLIANGVVNTVLLDGDLLIDVMFLGMYNPVVTQLMPRMIYEIRQGEYTILRDRLGLYFDPAGALGLQMAVQCAEEMPFTSQEEIDASAQGIQPQIAAFYTSSANLLFITCQEWNSTIPDPRENQPVFSDLPALVLAGVHDPITPPEWDRLAADTLSQAYFYEFDGNGHWVTRSSECARSIMLTFLQFPGSPPEDPCY